MPDRLQSEADGKEYIWILHIEILLFFATQQHSNIATTFVSYSTQMKLRNVLCGFVKFQFDIIWTPDQYESTS